MQLCGPNLPTKLGHLQAYADGFQLGVAHAINTPAPGNMTEPLIRFYLWEFNMHLHTFS